MIAALKGRVAAADGEGAVIDVGGVGYLVQCSARTRAALPAEGEAAELFVETHMRDDGILLYGFADRAERAWFRLLVKVQGVGARMALGVLSALGPDGLAAAVAAEDRAALRRASGVGPKAAGRIVAELKDKGTGVDAPPPAAAPPRGEGEGEGEGGAATVAEAVSALVNLGYGRGEAHAAAARAAARAGADAELAEVIRGGLAELAQP